MTAVVAVLFFFCALLVSLSGAGQLDEVLASSEIKNGL